tara:strand:- start:576 stop:812 length:237 start_codon:yes stop_codon:yes gene_type:complete
MRNIDTNTDDWIRLLSLVKAIMQDDYGTEQWASAYLMDSGYSEVVYDVTRWAEDLDYISNIRDLEDALLDFLEDNLYL